MHRAAPALALDAVILAGGRGSRLNGASKGDLDVGGRRLVDTALAAAADANARQRIVVGELAVPDGVVTLREEPPFGGPAAALAAALPRVTSPWLLLLACDLPRAGDLVSLLLAAVATRSHIPRVATSHAAPVEGYVIEDASSRVQWLSGLYSTEALRRALAEVTREHGPVTGMPARRVLRALTLVRVADRDGASLDIDTPGQLSAARARASAPTTAPRTQPKETSR